MSAYETSLRSRVGLVLRTVEVNFPGLVDAKYAAVREYCRLRSRPFERDFEALRRFPANGGLYLDIGANRGQSCDSILLCRPDARVAMFEPNRRLAAGLTDRYGRRPNVEVFAYGLGDAAFEADLFIPFYKGWMFDGWASFEEQNASSWLPHYIWRFDPHHVRVEQSRSEVRRLDDLSLAPFFVKMDVQGLEPAVLRGGRDTLARSEPVMLVESDGPGEVSEFLAGLGYVPFRWDDGRLVGDAYGDLNTYFIGADKQRLLRETSAGLLV